MNPELRAKSDLCGLALAGGRERHTPRGARANCSERPTGKTLIQSFAEGQQLRRANPRTRKITHTCRLPHVISRFLDARTFPGDNSAADRTPPLAGRRALETLCFLLTEQPLAPRIEKLKPTNASRRRVRRLIAAAASGSRSLNGKPASMPAA